MYEEAPGLRLGPPRLKLKYHTPRFQFARNFNLWWYNMAEHEAAKAESLAALAARTAHTAQGGC